MNSSSKNLLVAICLISLLLIFVIFWQTTASGPVKRAIGMKPSWRVVNETEAFLYDGPQCYGLGINNPYVDSCPMAIRVGAGDPCLELGFIYHLDELDGCIQMECILVPVSGNVSKYNCEVLRGYNPPKPPEILEMEQYMNSTEYRVEMDAICANQSVEAKVSENLTGGFDCHGLNTTYYNWSV